MRAHSFVLRDRVLAVAGLVALASAYLTPLVNAEWTGWRPDHGHMTLNGAVPTHTHPWETSASSASAVSASAVSASAVSASAVSAPSDVAASSDLPADGAGEQRGLVYQGNGDGVPGIAALWMPPVDASEVRVSEVAALATPGDPPVSAAILPSTPPPRG